MLALGALARCVGARRERVRRWKPVEILRTEHFFSDRTRCIAHSYGPEPHPAACSAVSLDRLLALGLVPAVLRERGARRRRAKVFAAGLVPHLVRTTCRKLPLPTYYKPPPPKAGQTKGLYWDTIGNADTEGTIWEGHNAEDNDDLAAFFPALETDWTKLRKKKKKKKRKKKKKDAKVSVIDGGCAQKINIAMSSYKGQFRELREQIENMDAEGIGLEKVEGLLSCMKFFNEAKGDVKKYLERGGPKGAKGNPAKLANAEKFVYEMLQVRDLVVRLKAMLFKVVFDESVQSLVKRVALLKGGMGEIMTSERLPQLLELFLAFGNKLNAGNRTRGGAKGMKLSSLMKLTQTKNNTGQTILEYIIANIDAPDRKPELLAVGEEFPTIPEARKVNVSVVEADLKKMSVGLGLIEKQIAKSRKLGDAEFARAMGPFSDAAAETIQGVQDDFDVFKGSFQQACKFLVCDPKKTEPEQLMGYIVGLLLAIKKTHALVLKKRKLKEKREKQEEAKRLKRRKRDAQKKAMLDRMSAADRDKAEQKAAARAAEAAEDATKSPEELAREKMEKRRAALRGGDD